jgi:hypothetical protein
VWVSLAFLARHPERGAVALPVFADLYVRRKDVAELPEGYKWPFRTKLQIAAGQVEALADWTRARFREVWVVTDGGYAKRPFLRACREQGVVAVSRLRKDAALFDLPALEPGKRGRPRKYGTNRIRLAGLAADESGWQEVACVQHGEGVVKTVKSFEATYRPASGAIRVVLVKEEDGWLPLFCTRPQATAKEVLEAAADRGSHEGAFKDVKEVWGADEQQVRNLWANVGCFNLCCWAYGLAEAWAWGKPEGELADRRASPWDAEPRRPSHRDKRNALQREAIRAEIEAVMARGADEAEMRRLLARVLHLAGRYDFVADPEPDDGPPSESEPTGPLSSHQPPRS